MIRDSDAFIGVYPFPGTMEESQHMEHLREASNYFRLEIDLAIRAQKPAIIFYDRRYGNILRVPPGIMKCSFDTREVGGAGGSPRARNYETEFNRFCERVHAFKFHQTTEHEKGQGKVGVFVPHGADSSAYQKVHLDAIRSVLESHGCDEVEILPWPFALDHKMLSVIDSIEWAVADIGTETAATGIPAFLHGRFLPTVRLQSDSSPSSFEQALTIALEVGYKKDIIRWDNADKLKEELDKRVVSLLFERQQEIKRFSITQEAEQYFRSAALYKENVFVSYAGKNLDIASGIAGAFKRRFRDVFDYRDGESIRSGEPWLPEIFNRLATSAIGIPLLSPDYFESGNCAHEAIEMIARQDSGQMKVIPIKISADKFDLPPWISATQYERFESNQDPDDLVKRVVSRVGLAG